MAVESVCQPPLSIILSNASSSPASNTSSDSPPVNVYLTPEFQSYAQELINSGYSHVQSQALAEALSNSRQVIEAKHQAYTDRLNDDRLADMTVEAVGEFVREFDHLGSGVTPAERRALVAILVKEVAKDNAVVVLSRMVRKYLISGSKHLL